MLIEKIELVFLWFMIYSVIGWLYETILCSVRERHFVYRGFLFGPYCPIYGWGALLILLFLGKIQHVVPLFFAGALLTCSLEYVTGWAMEAMFHAKWWDYSHMRFHIHGRVCLLGAVAFGSFAVLHVKYLHPFVSSCTALIPPAALHAITALLFILYLVDNIVTFRGFGGFDKKLRTLSEELKKQKGKVADSASLAMAGFFKSLNRHERRMIRAFPKFRPLRYNDAFSALRRWFLKKKTKNVTAADAIASEGEALTAEEKGA